MSSFASTTTPLKQSGASNSADQVVLGPIQTFQNTKIAGTVFADQNGTVYIEQTFDGTNYDGGVSHSVTANTGLVINEEIVAPVVRVRFVNTAGSDQTKFRLYVRAFGVRGT